MRLLTTPPLSLPVGFSGFIGFLCLLLCLISLPSSALPSSPEGWKQAAINDINEAYQIFLDNHPGVYDPKNPEFASQLTESKKRGLSYAAKVNDASSHRFAVLGFTAAMGDGHAALMATAKPDIGAFKWPGFFTAWRQQGLFVADSRVKGVAVGAEVIACDGKPIKNLIEDNVFSFEGRKKELGQWWTYAPHVFIDFNNPFVTVPGRCLFRVANKTIEHDLQWQGVVEDIVNVLSSAYMGDVKDVGVTEPRPKLLWVSMSSFQPNEQQRNIYRAMNDELRSNHRRYDQADAVVIDLRQNQGGSSQWSLDFAKALWGDTAVSQRWAAKAPSQTVWWRASKDNTAYVQYEMVSLLKKMKQIENANIVEKLGADMKSALRRGEKFYIEYDDEANKEKKAPLKENPIATIYKNPVYVIVPGYCASACLDALDIFSLFENTQLVGAPSSGDSTYMDVRHQITTSGTAQISIPNKVYVNRVRGNGEVYLPGIYANDLQWSSENFLAIVEKALVVTKR